MKKILLFAFMIFLMLNLAAQTGSITNIRANQRTDGTGNVDIFYDLAGPGSGYNLTVEVSINGGSSFTVLSEGFLSGDLHNVYPGNDRHITWNGAASHPATYSPSTIINIIAVEAGNTGIPCPGTPTVTDIDGNVYNTVFIGGQCWMKENLKTTRKADGNSLVRFCPENNLLYCDLYGGLYKWVDAIVTHSNSNPSGIIGPCPNGWHVPSGSEWDQLLNFLITTYSEITGDNVGNSLKSCRQVSSPSGGSCNTNAAPRWNSNTTNYGSDDFGFSALPGGHLMSSGGYESAGGRSTWWSCTQGNSSGSPVSISKYLLSNSGQVMTFGQYQISGLSIRCVKD